MPVNAAPASSDSTRERARPRRTATPYARSGSTARRMAPGRNRKAIAARLEVELRLEVQQQEQRQTGLDAGRQRRHGEQRREPGADPPDARSLLGRGPGEGRAPAEQEHRGGRARRSADHEQRPVADEAEQGHADEERHQGAVLLAREQPGVRRRVDGELRAGLGAQRDPEERAARAADRRADGDQPRCRARPRRAGTTPRRARRRRRRGCGGRAGRPARPRAGARAARAPPRWRRPRRWPPDVRRCRRRPTAAAGSPAPRPAPQPARPRSAVVRRWTRCQPQAGRGYRLSGGGARARPRGRGRGRSASG